MELRKKVAFLAAAAIVLFASAAFCEPLPESERTLAPDFKTDLWINSAPLTLEQLKGKVVLIDFWEYTCINCIRTFPYLRRWHQLYSPLGLVVIGVHTPEFDFAKDPKRVADATKRFGFAFPIAVDSNRDIWRAFRNDAWPSKYPIDKNGRIALNHKGEGDYAAFELVIQQLLKEANPKLTFTEAKYQPPPDEGEAGKVCRRPTPELYLGSDRGSRDYNDGGYKESAAFTYKLPDKIPDEAFALKGKWNAQPEFIRHLSDSSDDFLRLNYEAKAVYLVAGIGGGKPQKLFVSQDEKPLPTKARGVDVKDDKTGRTYVELTKKRMYYIVDNPGFEGHQLDLSPQGAGVELYSFTFGNDCENKFDHK